MLLVECAEKIRSTPASDKIACIHLPTVDTMIGLKFKGYSALRWPLDYGGVVSHCVNTVTTF